MAPLAARHKGAVLDLESVRMLRGRLPAGESFAIKEAGEAILGLRESTESGDGQESECGGE
jgi:hypothetical protein